MISPPLSPGATRFIWRPPAPAASPTCNTGGGKTGFLKILDDSTLAFADFGSNKQFITAGNLSENDKAYIFLMDYANRRRIKLWGRARVIEDDPELLEWLVDADYKAVPERAIVFELTAWDVNCPQHIPRKLSESEIAAVVQPLRERIEELEAKLAAPGP